LVGEEIVDLRAADTGEPRITGDLYLPGDLSLLGDDIGDMLYVSIA